ncbi:MAG: ATP-binding cassette domain-containing protein [Sphingobacteriaceae bacterium]|nr:ATP-binding cassette domain-containing protein [Sphingobacteriaceae bacterium]
MIVIENLAQHYANGLEIKFKNWELAAGEQCLLLGNSGSGKTTLMHILSGILAPTQGKVSIKEVDIYALSAKELDKFRGQNIGLVFQRPHLIKSLTIAENLFLAQSLAQLPKDAKRVEEVLNALAIADKGNNYPSQLSEGQLQRVSIARAVLNKPTLLIADEPTASLDDENAQSVLNLLQQQSKIYGATLLVATHDKRVKEAFTNTYLLA